MQLSKKEVIYIIRTLNEYYFTDKNIRDIVRLLGDRLEEEYEAFNVAE